MAATQSHVSTGRAALDQPTVGTVTWAPKCWPCCINKFHANLPQTFFLLLRLPVVLTRVSRVRLSAVFCLRLINNGCNQRQSTNVHLHQHWANFGNILRSVTLIGCPSTTVNITDRKQTFKCRPFFCQNFNYI